MISIQAQVSASLRQAHDAIARELADAAGFGGATGRELVREVGAEDVVQNVQTFARETQPGGGPWRPLSPDYAKRKRRERPGRKILVWDGQLRHSLAAASDPHRIARVKGGKLELGTNHPLGVVHQFGAQGTAQRRAHRRRTKGGGWADVRAGSVAVRLPARPMVGKSAQQLADLKASISRVLMRRMEQAVPGRLRNLRLAAARASGRLVVVERGR